MLVFLDDFNCKIDISTLIKLIKIKNEKRKKRHFVRFTKK